MPKMRGKFNVLKDGQYVEILVEQAEKDADGNVISEVYAKKDDIANGLVIALKASELEKAFGITVADHDGTNAGEKSSADGSADVVLKLPATIKADLSGNADTASKLESSFSLQISDYSDINSGAAEDVDGSKNVKLHLPKTMEADITGNSGSADKLKTARKVSLTGDITGSASFDGTGDVTIETTAEALTLIGASGLYHNGIYRGENLGAITSVEEMNAFIVNHEVAEGMFADLYIGDYLTIQDGTYNKEWEIAGFDTYLHKGDAELTSHHICLIPKTNLTTSYMNGTDTTAGGFVNSYMCKTVLPTVNSKLASVLGNHLLTRRALLSNTINTNLSSGAGAGWMGCATDWAWYDVKACLMSEVAVYGSKVFSSSFFDIGEDCERLPIFSFKGHSYSREWFWLRAVASSARFAVAAGYGHAYSFAASTAAGGVSPLICVG